MRGERSLYCLLFSYFIILVTCSPEPTKPCEGPLKCCSGYRWDTKSKICVECPAGHFGPHCELNCRFPTFGLFCQGLCTCDRSNCHYVKGCFYDGLPKTGNDTTYKAETQQQSRYSVHKEEEKSGSKLFTQDSEESNVQKITATDEGTKKTEQIRIGILSLVGIAGFLVAIYLVSFICKKKSNNYKKMEDLHVFLDKNEVVHIN